MKTNTPSLSAWLSPPVAPKPPALERHRELLLRSILGDPPLNSRERKEYKLLGAHVRELDLAWRRERDRTREAWRRDVREALGRRARRHRTDRAQNPAR